MKQRFVKCERLYYKAINKDVNEFTPVELRNGNLYGLKLGDEVQKFETLEEAQKVLTTIEDRENEER